MKQAVFSFSSRGSQYFSRILFVLLLLLLVGTTARAQAPAWQNAISASGYYRVLAMAADDNGNVYLAGQITGRVDFGAISVTTANNNDTDGFVAKWSNVSRSYVWVKGMGGTSNTDEARGIAVSGSNVYVTGFFVSNTASFGSITLTNAGSFSMDVFVAKLIDAGSSASFAWAQRAGGTGSDNGLQIAVSGTSVYVAGYGGALSSFGTTVLPANTSSFVAKLTDSGSSGNFAWAQPISSSLMAIARGVAASGPNVYVVGEFRGATANFGSITLTNTAVTDTYEAFIVKLTDAGSTGSFTWARLCGGLNNDRANAVAAKGTSVFVVGNFQGSATFGSSVLAAATADEQDGFITKLVDSGNTAAFIWTQQLGGAGGYDNPVALVPSGSDVYVAGNFQAPTATFGNNRLVVAGVGDVFVTKLNDAGASASFTWAQRGGGVDNDFGTALAVQGPNVYVGGLVTPPASFGSFTITGVAFLASLVDTQPLATVAPALLAEIAPYPNPARATITLPLPSVPGLAHATLLLTNALGQAVRMQELALPMAQETATMSVLGIKPGVYHLHLLVGDQRKTHPLVIE